ncbi:hypothetical protein [Azospirillum argentinense]|uniref:Uncharacterized protein n=1 Tax=Azospirillum brasilense TaxID=192 RepID=A0A4D8QE03_AZOBR|nr:hypothetical protein [Azospirillum argentinense]QCO07471.1 hypothetical protein D3867_36930 [Azospirillum argentinense]
MGIDDLLPGQLTTGRALKDALDLLGMSVKDFHDELVAATSDGEKPVARSTVTRWLGDTSPVPAAVKLWMRDRLLVMADRSRGLRIDESIIIPILGTGGVGKTPIALKLAHVARLWGLDAVYLDAVDELANEGWMKIAGVANPRLVLKRRDRLRTTIQAITDKPRIIVIDTPVGSFFDTYQNDKAFEEDLLTLAHHVVIVADASRVRTALKIAEHIRPEETDWRILLCDRHAFVDQIADAVAEGRAAGARFAPEFLRAPDHVADRDMLNALRSDANALGERQDFLALSALLDEFLQERGVSMADSDMPIGMDSLRSITRFEDLVDELNDRL